MKISRNWLQPFFDAPLPQAQILADALTFHAFEIESITTYDVVMPPDTVLDVKVTPNRGHDCLSYRGIAKEISAILDLPLVPYPYGIRDTGLVPKTDAVKVTIEGTGLCSRYIAGYIRGVKVGPSSEWLRTSLEAAGQKSINNIVDATNYVMFNIGQPLHAFDASKLVAKGGNYSIKVHLAKKGEKMLALDDKEYTLSDSTLAIVDGNSDKVIGIAGVKGGKPTGVDEKTTGIILEAANFDGVSVRKTAQALKLRTDASMRFEQVLSPELAAYGIRAAAELIVKLAGGEVVGFADEYPNPQKPVSVAISVEKINKILGTELTGAEVAGAFTRLGLPYKEEAGVFEVHPPFERLDLVIPEDLVEEVARIVGYDEIPAVELPPFPKNPDVNPNFYAAEKKREELIAQGYSEVFTSVFAEKGERAVLNKVGGEKPYLRTNISDGLGGAMFKNLSNKELLGLEKVKIFEIGTVWKDGKEKVNVATLEGERQSVEHAWQGTEKILDGVPAPAYENLPISKTEHYQPFSKYPSIVRDIALWVPTETEPENVLAVIRKAAGELLVRSEKFDEFKKGDKTSLAFRLVFQSFDRTLTDEDANSRMESVYAAAKKEGWEVR